MTTPEGLMRFVLMECSLGGVSSGPLVVSGYVRFQRNEWKERPYRQNLISHSESISSSIDPSHPSRFLLEIGRPRSRRSILTGSSVRFPSSPSTAHSSRRMGRKSHNLVTIDPRFGRQLTRHLGDSSAGARPTARDTLQICHNECP
jgi:hypothetical protein